MARSKDFLDQLGGFETANGLPHGPLAIVIAFGLALIVYPMSRLLRSVTRR